MLNFPSLSFHHGETIDMLRSTVQAFAADGTSDFSHTLALDVTGVPFTSSSGVFLTEQGESTVPEPSSLRLVALGMAAVAVSRRYRAKRG